jgi:hypothetical protein
MAPSVKKSGWATHPFGTKLAKYRKIERAIRICQPAPDRSTSGINMRGRAVAKIRGVEELERGF